MANPCLDCWTPTTNGARCPACQAGYVRRRAHATPTRTHRGTYQWEQQAKQTVALWRDTNGDWCPGWRRPAHPSRDLTADHWHPGNPDVVVVLCRRCNSSKADIIPTVDDHARLVAAMGGG